MRSDLTPEPPPRLAWAEHQGETCLRLTGLAPPGADCDAGAARGLAVLPGEIAPAQAARMQPAAGRFVVLADGVDFIPRFPFVDGAAYSLIIDPCAAHPSGFALTLRRANAGPSPTPDVAAIHPDVAVVPLNLLKFYVRFSEPMAEGAVRRSVHVERADTGERLEHVLLDMDPELWDPQRRRLTLLLDPGRIKRGLAPHQEADYPLTEGVSIRLTIGGAFRSAAGAPLRSAFSRTYSVGAALRRPVAPSAWRLEAPDAGSVGPLTVGFDRPLDHAMLAHAFQIVDPAGRAVAGTEAPHAGELGWTFLPSQAWAPGEHQLVVNARLEDLAGNSPRRVFDRDLAQDGDLVTEADHVVLGFRCRPPLSPATDRE